MRRHGRNHWTGWLVLLLIVTGCGSPSQPIADSDDERVAIYRAILATEPFYGRASTMYAETVVNPDMPCPADALATEFPGLPPALINAWCVTNHPPRPHDPAIIAALGLLVTTEPHGALHSSAVQVDATTTHALVRIERWAGDFGMACYYWLTNQHGVWQITKTWVASIT